MSWRLVITMACALAAPPLLGCGPVDADLPGRNYPPTWGVRVDTARGFEQLPPGEWRFTSGYPTAPRTIGHARYVIHHPVGASGGYGAPFAEVVLAPETLDRVDWADTGGWVRSLLYEQFEKSHWMRIGFRQDLDAAPLGQRYLYTDDFTGVRLMLARHREAIYIGEAVEWSMAVDLAEGAFYGEFTGLLRADWPTVGDEDTLVSMTFVGVLDREDPCRWHNPPPADWAETRWGRYSDPVPDDDAYAGQVVACDAAVAAIAAAPADPSGPQPPWPMTIEDPDSDVVHTCPGAPCNFD